MASSQAIAIRDSNKAELEAFKQSENMKKEM